MSQLVGRACIRCGDRIPSELDARFCPACGAPVHLRCMKPPAGDGCPTCGGPVAAVPPEPPPPPPRQPWPLRLKLFLTAFFALAAMWGCRQVYWSVPSPLDLVVPVALSVALAWWAVADAAGRRKPLPLLSRPWLFLAGILLVPGYVIWTRRWRGAGWVLLHFVTWYLVAFVTMHLAGVVMYGEAWVRAVGL